MRERQWSLCFLLGIWVDGDAETQRYTGQRKIWKAERMEIMKSVLDIWNRGTYGISRCRHSIGSKTEGFWRATMTEDPGSRHQLGTVFISDRTGTSVQGTSQERIEGQILKNKSVKSNGQWQETKSKESEARQTFHWSRVWNKDSGGVTRPVIRLGCLNISCMPALQDQADLPWIPRPFIISLLCP